MEFSRKTTQAEPAVNTGSPRTKTRGSDWIQQFADCLKKPAESEAVFFTSNDIYRTYSTMRLRRFRPQRTQTAPPILIVTPLTVHDSGIADLATGHSLVERLTSETKATLYVTDWLSATPGMQNFSIDTYLAELNVAIDDLGGCVDVIGLCQGGWLALLHAARFPGKIRRLVLAGTPADTDACLSQMTHVARELSGNTSHFPESEIVSGAQWLAPLGCTQGLERAAVDTLQRNPASFANADLQAIARYEAWTRRDFDLSGSYCRALLQRLFIDNELAAGTLSALGQTVELTKIRIPLFILCGARDEITPKAQALAVLDLVGTPKMRSRSLIADCGHFSLFVGASTLTHEWKTIAGWLTSQAPSGGRRAA